MQIVELQSLCLANLNNVRKFILREYVYRGKDKVKPYIKYLMTRLRKIEGLTRFIIIGDEDFIDAGLPFD